MHGVWQSIAIIIAVHELISYKWMFTAELLYIYIHYQCTRYPSKLSMLDLYMTYTCIPEALLDLCIPIVNLQDLIYSCIAQYHSHYYCHDCIVGMCN